MDQPFEIIIYWRSLIHLVTHPKTSIENVDAPLPSAAARAKWAISWTVLCAWLTILGILAIRGQRLSPTVDHMLGVSSPGTVIWISFLLCGILAIPIAYGVLRLYTLVSHVLTLNVFKVRGQRLRLLNLETTLLPLSVLICIGVLIAEWNRIAGIVFIALVALYALWLIALGYNHIFHKRTVHGLLLFIEGTLVTWFVLCIGALAITVMAAVLAFFAILILRSFHRA